MGNCLIKNKEPYCQRLQAEIYYLEKENIRTYDFILAELESLKVLLSERKPTNPPAKPIKISSV